MKQTYRHTYLFKAQWRNTSLTLRVDANNDKQAYLKAWGMVSRMFGGSECEKVIPLGQVR